MYAKLQELEAGDILVLAGSIPDTLPENVYEQIMERMEHTGVHVVVDATGELLKRVLKISSVSY